MGDDYTILPEYIVKLMQESGEPLTESQRMILAGSLAQMQMTISHSGLKQTIANFSNPQK